MKGQHKCELGDLSGGTFAWGVGEKDPQVSNGLPFTLVGVVSG